VVANASMSRWRLVMSGVPQGDDISVHFLKLGLNNSKVFAKNKIPIIIIKHNK